MVNNNRIKKMIEEYQKFVKQYTNPNKDVLEHAILGICTEAGELLDIYKKHKMYDKPLDKEHLKEEIGDLLFYVFMLNIVADINLDYKLLKSIDNDYFFKKIFITSSDLLDEYVRENHEDFFCIDIYDMMIDLTYFCATLLVNYNFTFEETLTHNMNKLKKRYPNGGYSNTDAIERKDKNE